MPPVTGKQITTSMTQITEKHGLPQTCHKPLTNWDYHRHATSYWQIEITTCATSHRQIEIATDMLQVTDKVKLPQACHKLQTNLDYHRHTRSHWQLILPQTCHKSLANFITFSCTNDLDCKPVDIFKYKCLVILTGNCIMYLDLKKYLHTLETYQWLSEK